MTLTPGGDTIGANMGTNDELLRTIEDFARKAHDGSPPSHDFSHVQRVLRIALVLAREEGADLFVVAAAALLHDIGRSAEARMGPDPDRHEELSADRAAPFLDALGLDETTVRRILEAILAHRHRRSREPRSKEAECLFDADKLDSLGAVGVARAYLWLGECGRSVHYPREEWIDIDPANNAPEVDSFQREWHIKLRHLSRGMRTAGGRRMAEDRHRRMERILLEIAAEVEPSAAEPI